MQRMPPSSLRPKKRSAPRWAQAGSMRPTCPCVSRNATSRSPSICTRTGAQSGSGSSRDRATGSQKRRKYSPIGVPGPVRVKSSLSAGLNTTLASGASLRPIVAREHGALGLVVHFGLEGVAVLEGDRLLGGRTGADLVDQALHVAELRRMVAEDVRRQSRPAPQGHVDDSVSIASHIFVLRQARVHDAPVAQRFELVALE